MKEKAREKLESRKRVSLTGEEYLFASDVPELIDENTPSLSTFRRRVSEKAIRTVNFEGQREAAYNIDDVEKFLQGELSLKRGGARRKKSHNRVNHTQSFLSTVTPKSAVIRPLTRDDIGDVYRLQFKQLGIDNAVQPTSMDKWVEEGKPIFWVAQDPENSNRIWAAFGAIPLDEGIIVQFLRDEYTLQEIAITDVLSYQVGQSYTCYIIAATNPDYAGPEYQDTLVQLMEYLLNYWCEQYPNVSIRMLYLSTPTKMEDSPLLRMIRTFFFSRRRDISMHRGVWELPLDEYNPAPAIERFQKCIKEKDMILLVDEPVVRSEEDKSVHPFNGPLQYRPARTKEDVAAMVQIGAEIFLPPGVQPSIPNEHQTEVWYSWLVKNPEIFYVVAVNDEIIGYISLVPLHQDIIDKVMRGAHPTTITPDDVLMFEPGLPLDTYVHIWGTTPRLTPTQKRYASAKMLRELRKTFDSFARRGIDVRSIWTRSNKEDGIGISQHIGFEDLEVPGVTDAENLADRKHVFRVDTAKSTNSFMVHYRQALKEYSPTPAVKL